MSAPFWEIWPFLYPGETKYQRRHIPSGLIFWRLWPFIYPTSVLKTTSGTYSVRDVPGMRPNRSAVVRDLMQNEDEQVEPTQAVEHEDRRLLIRSPVRSPVRIIPINPVKWGSLEF